MERLAEIRHRLQGVSDPLELLAGLFAVSPVAYQVYSADGHSLLTNQAHRDLFGSEPPPDYNVLEDEIARKTGALELIHRAFRGETVQTPTVWYDPRELPGMQHVEGRRVAMSSATFPLTDAAGVVTHVVFAFKDVTSELLRDRAEREKSELEQAQAALRASEQRYRSIVETAREGIWLIDLEGITTFVNQTMASMLGYSVEEMNGLSMYDLVVPEETEVASQRLDRRRQGIAEQHDSRLRHKNGSVVRVHMSTNSVRDPQGQVVGALGMVTDVTAQRRLEEEREELLEKEREARETLQLVMDTIPQRLFWKDRNYRFLGGNRAFVEDAGLADLAEITGRDDFELVWKDLASRYRADDRLVVEQEQSKVGIEEPLVRADGSLRWLRTTKVPLRDRHGAVIGLFGSYEDITDERRSEEQLALLSGASDLLAASLDEHSTLTAFTEWTVPAVADGCEVLLYGEDKPLARATVAHTHAPARHWLETHPPVWTDFLQRSPDVPVRLESVPDEVWPEDDATPDDVKPKSAMLLPLTHQGEALGLLVFTNGPTRRPFDDTDLRLGLELSWRLATAMKNARLYTDAQRAVRIREDFLSVASHELNTPLTPLTLKLQSLDRMVRAAGQQLPPQVREATAVALRQTRRLSALVAELLDVSRIQSGRLSLELESVELGALVAEVVERYEDQLRQVGCTVIIKRTEPLHGLWDRLRLERVVTNLLSNAMKYGPGKPIRVTVTRDGPDTVMSVADRGIGIAPADLARIFGRFERGVSERHYGGLGLGLFISRQIVERLGGTLEAASDPEGGAVFTVRLPLMGPRDDARAT